jgi:transposase
VKTLHVKRLSQALRRSSVSSGCVQCQTLREQNAALRRDNGRLLKENEACRQQIVSLRESLAEAHRAAKRQAAPFSKGPPKANPKRPGRKAGKHYGVKARRPVPHHVDDSYDAPLPPRCRYCGGEVVETDTAWHYEEDIPPVRPVVRGFNVHIGHCVRCKRSLRGRHPLQSSEALGAAGVSIGPRALALAAELNKGIGTSFGKLSGIFRTAFRLSISRGGLSLALGRVARTLAPTYDALVEQVRSAPVVAADETGWKVGGWLWWLWVFVTPKITVYRIMDGRGYAEACSVLGIDFHQTLLRDGWSPYRRFEYAVHQTCVGGHLIRRLKLNLETAERGTARLPHAILRILERSLRLRDHWLDHPPTPHGRATHAGRLAAAMDRFLAWNPADHENRKLVKHLRHEHDALFTFLRDPSVPASNWWGEQAIRPAVVTRKVWGGNRTTAGALTQQIIASVLRTSRQQGIDPCTILEDVLCSPIPSVASLPSLASGP